VYDTSDDSSYDAVEGNIEPHARLFSKQPVSLTEEHTRNSLLTNDFAKAITAAGVVPSASKPFIPFDENLEEVPLASLTLGKALKNQVGAELLADQSLRKQAHFEQVPNVIPPPASFLQTLVKIFAGRKKESHDEHMKKGRNSKPNLGESPLMEEVDKETNDRPSHIFSNTRLTLAQVIPDVCPPHAEALTQRPGYREIMPAALENRYIGYAVVKPDVFTPQQVQRGFDINLDATENPPSVPPPTTALASLAYRAHKEGNSAAKLLDRDSGSWAHWYDKNPNPEKMSFAKEPSTGSGGFK